MMRTTPDFSFVAKFSQGALLIVPLNSSVTQWIFRTLSGPLVA
jgi:hypothetical protein